MISLLSLPPSPSLCVWAHTTRFQMVHTEARERRRVLYCYFYIYGYLYIYISISISIYLVRKECETGGVETERRIEEERERGFDCMRRYRTLLCALHASFTSFTPILLLLIHRLQPWRISWEDGVGFGYPTPY